MRSELPARLIDPVLSKQEAADLLGISTDGLERALRRGDAPPAIRLTPRRVGFRLSSINQWLSEREIAPQPQAEAV